MSREEVRGRTICVIKWLVSFRKKGTQKQKYLLVSLVIMYCFEHRKSINIFIMLQTCKIKLLTFAGLCEDVNISKSYVAESCRLQGQGEHL